MPAFKNIQFKVFHNMCMALGPIGKDKNNKIIWLFECFEGGPGCVGEFEAIVDKVRRGGRKSCGCHRRKDISGKIFYDSDGTPTCQALWWLDTNEWLFRCLVNGPGCKWTFPSKVCAVENENQRSCGCYNRMKIKEACTTHGMSNTPEYISYQAMHQRCYNSNNPGYKYYGDKGIKVEWEWNSRNPDGFTNFLRDKGPITDSNKNTMERFDNDSDYGLKNDNGWISQADQNRNKTSNKVTLEEAEFVRDLYFNRKVSIKNIAEFFRCSEQIIRNIINYKTWKTG